MKKSLLMTTALVAAFSATNVCAEDWTISSKETITDEFISRDTGVFVKGNGADVNIQGGDINLTDSRIYKGNDTATTGDINISGGNITLNKNAYIEMRKENTGNVNMTGGKLVLNENSGLLLNTNDDQGIDGNASIKIIFIGFLTLYLISAFLHLFFINFSL